MSEQLLKIIRFNQVSCIPSFPKMPGKYFAKVKSEQEVEAMALENQHQQLNRSLQLQVSSFDLHQAKCRLQTQLKKYQYKSYSQKKNSQSIMISNKKIKELRNSSMTFLGKSQDKIIQTRVHSVEIDKEAIIPSSHKSNGSNRHSRKAQVTQRLKQAYKKKQIQGGQNKKFPSFNFNPRGTQRNLARILFGKKPHLMTEQSPDSNSVCNSECKFIGSSLSPKQPLRAKFNKLVLQKISHNKLKTHRQQEDSHVKEQPNVILMSKSNILEQSNNNPQTFLTERTVDEPKKQQKTTPKIIRISFDSSSQRYGARSTANLPASPRIPHTSIPPIPQAICQRLQKISNQMSAQDLNQTQCKMGKAMLLTRCRKDETISSWI